MVTNRATRIAVSQCHQTR